MTITAITQKYKRTMMPFPICTMRDEIHLHLEVTGFVQRYFKVTFGKLLFTKALLLVLLWTFAWFYLIIFNPQRLYKHSNR